MHGAEPGEDEAHDQRAAARAEAQGHLADLDGQRAHEGADGDAGPDEQDVGHAEGETGGAGAPAAGSAGLHEGQHGADRAGDLRGKGKGAEGPALSRLLPTEGEDGVGMRADRSMSVKDAGWPRVTSLSSADWDWRALVASYSLQAASKLPPTSFGPSEDRIQADPAVPKMYVTA